MLAVLEARLQSGLKLLQVREPGLSAQERDFFTRQAIGLAHRHGCKVLTKSPFAGADGVHVTSTELKMLREKPAALAAASCHNREELERAMALGLDFAVLGPVREKSTVDKSPAFGWEAIRRHCARHRAAGLCDRRPDARRPAGGLARRRARHRYDSGGLELGSSFSRQAVFLRCPLAEVDQPAALAAERPPRVLGRVERLRAATRARNLARLHRLQKVSSKPTSQSAVLARATSSPFCARKRMLSTYLLALISGTQAQAGLQAHAQHLRGLAAEHLLERAQRRGERSAACPTRAGCAG